LLKQGGTAVQQLLSIIRSLRVRLVIALAATAIAATSHASAVVLNPTENCVIRDGDGTNYFSIYSLLASELDTSGPGTVWLSVLKFDLTPIVGTTVVSASLELTSFANHAAATFVHNVYSSSDDSWTESGVNGVNRPADGTLTFQSSTNIDNTSQAYTWSVLAGVIGPDGLGGSGNTLTLLVRPDLSQAGTPFGPHFYDRRASAGGPRLILDVRPLGVETVSWARVKALYRP
jgi:hypothetical protein